MNEKRRQRASSGFTFLPLAVSFHAHPCQQRLLAPLAIVIAVVFRLHYPPATSVPFCPALFTLKHQLRTSPALSIHSHSVDINQNFLGPGLQ